MRLICPNCAAANKPKARSCIQCGQPFSLGESTASDPLLSGLQWAAGVLESDRPRRAVAGAGRLLQRVGKGIESGVTALIDSETGKAVSSEAAASLDQLQRYWRERQQDAVASPATDRTLCPRCGGENRPGARFCHDCAAPLTEDEFPDRLTWQGDALSDPGRVRPNNEDVVRLWPGTNRRVWAALVADGMGGAAAGEVASGLAAAAVDEHLRNHVFRPGMNGLRPNLALPDELGNAVQLANERVYRQAREGGKQAGMGTTATLALVQDGWLHLAHVGDSRAYLVTQHGLLLQMTDDHSLVASLVAIGDLTPVEAAVHPQRNLLYRCLGHQPDVPVDLARRRLLPGDTLLLCSDGLTAHLERADIAALVSGGSDPKALATQLVAQANAGGGTDNISVAVMVTEEGDR